MAAVFSRTRFTTCIPPALGGSGNPSGPTARGVVRGMEAALAHLGRGGLAGTTVAVQGLGHVGEPLVERLRERGVARVIGSDLDPARCEALRRRFGAPAGNFTFTARTAGRDDCWILEQPADVFAPCATGGVLGPRTIPRLGAGIVSGAANNQLEDPERDDLLLHGRGVLYLPDFLVNRMGIVHCADEQYGYVGDEDPRIAAHLGTLPRAPARAPASTPPTAGRTASTTSRSPSLPRPRGAASRPCASPCAWPRAPRASRTRSAATPPRRSSPRPPPTAPAPPPP